jgi:hypothetical protein
VIKLPSVTYIVEHAKAAFNRFPYVLICSALSGFIAILLIEAESDDFWYIKLAMTLGLGIALFFSLTLYFEKPHPKYKFTAPRLLIGAGVLLVGFYLLSGGAPTENFYLNFAQWALALHLLAAFSPFLATGETRGFWQYNRALFLRFLLSALYAAVFYVGVIIALAAIDNLLNIKIHEKLYADIWVFSVSVLMTWHFLAGVPRNLKDLDKDDSYPGGLKVFTQYLLVPLVTLYLVILYLYLGKVLIKATWPQGHITWLVSLVAVAGVFNLLLLQPVQEKAANGWIRTYAKGFYLALFPLLGMLFVAVGKRIGQYGITEQRYFVTILGLWIFGIALYFLLHAKPTIKTVPLTLFVLTLITSLGPWGAYSASRYSQMERLKAYFIKDGLWNGTKAVKTDKVIPLEDRKEMSSILDYLVENHGVAPLQSWFDLDLSKWKDDRVRSRYGYSSVTGDICKSLGFEYVNRWGGASGASYFYYYAEYSSEAIRVDGYEWMIPASKESKFHLGGRSAEWEGTGAIMTFKQEGEADLVFDLTHMITELQSAGKTSNIPQERMQMDAKNSSWEGRLVLKSVNGNGKDKDLSVSSVGGTLLLKRLK